MSYIAFSAFQAKLSGEIWPSGAPENTVNAQRTFFVQSLMEIQKWVTCMRVANTSVFEQCATFFDCGKSWVDSPNGKIRRIWTVANDTYCNKVDYRRADWADLEDWSKNLLLFNIPSNAGKASLPLGHKYAESGSDSTCGRSRTGLWSVYRRRLYLAPWIQSNEAIIVEWDGLQSYWLDSDLLNQDYWTPREEMAIKDFVLYQYESSYGDPQQAMFHKGRFDNQLAELIHDCNELIRQQRDEIYVQNDPATSQNLLDEVIPTITVPETPTITAMVGDIGVTTNAAAVAALVAGWSPSKTFLLGDNIYAIADLGTVFDGYYPTERYPAWGNHDWDSDTNLAASLAKVSLPGNERYYDVVAGEVHYFILSSDAREPDGGYLNSTTSTQASVMGQWLQAKLGLSTARWKVVVMHDAPYSSDVNHGNSAWMQWPFQTWGANLVVAGHGHNYERVINGTLNYLVVGIGGQSLRGFGAVVTGSQVRYNAKYGALKITSKCSSMLVQAYAVDGGLIDSMTLTYP